MKERKVIKSVLRNRHCCDHDAPLACMGVSLLSIKKEKRSPDLRFRNQHRVSEHNPLDCLCAGRRGERAVVAEIFSC